MTFIASVHNENYSDQKALLDPPKKRNLIICLEKDSYNSLLDTDNTLWKIEFLQDFTKYDTILDKYKDDDIMNIAIVHHGSRYCPKVLAKDQPKLRWSTKFAINSKFKEMDDGIGTEEEKESLTLEEYENKLIDIFKKSFVYEDSYRGYFTLFVCIKRILNRISDTGNYLSIACDEADDGDFLQEFGSYTNKEIKIYANKEKTVIKSTQTSKYGSLSIQNFGSVLNCPLTEWKRNVSQGWSYLDVKSQSVVDTKKDLILYGYGKKPFEEIAGGSISEEKIGDRQKYYSKKYRAWYIKNWGKEAYEKWKAGMKKYI